MGLNIKNAEVERLAAEVAQITGESKTEAIRKALLERRAQLGGLSSQERTKGAFLRWEQNAKQKLPGGFKMPSKAEWEDILGYGPDGV